MNVASCLFYCPSGGKRDSYIPLRICPYLHSPRSREDRRFDTTKNQKTGQEKVEISSPMGSTKHSNGRCALPSPIAPRGAIEGNRLSSVAKDKNQNPPARLNGSVAPVAASSCKAKPSLCSAGARASLASAPPAAYKATTAWPENAGFWVGDSEREGDAPWYCHFCAAGCCCVQAAT